MSATVVFEDRGLVVRFAELGRQLGRPEALARVVGREGDNRLKAHFRAKDRNEPNRLNPGRRQHLWLQIGKSVSAPAISAGGTEVRITISDPRFAQKVFGGPIKPKRAGVKTLAIPVSPDAYARSPKSFEHETGGKLFLLRVGGRGGSRFANAVLATARGGGIQVEYVLKPFVVQKPDPTALPERRTFEAALLGRAERYVARKTAEAAGGATPGGTES